MERSKSPREPESREAEIRRLEQFLERSCPIDSKQRAEALLRLGDYLDDREE